MDGEKTKGPTTNNLWPVPKTSSDKQTGSSNIQRTRIMPMSVGCGVSQSSLLSAQDGSFFSLMELVLEMTKCLHKH